MGADGGIRLKSKDFKTTLSSNNNYLQKHTNPKECKLTGQKLELPVVIDNNGDLFNLKSIEIAKEINEIPKEFEHLLNDDYVSVNVYSTSNDMSGWYCPLTQEKYSNDNNRFLISFPCGCLFCDVVEELIPLDKECPVCGEEIIKFIEL
eukprot:TRINITY_DN4785_c0_g1_i1.p1 TRINITY_DN4785_c0_g1~~TRINITY_DN4785_c0_g1_i1.p1  ORF type:complete len:149 (+),score=34.82 TRINITY_DN4785_c0_g1_i1:49-495(+)